MFVSLQHREKFDINDYSLAHLAGRSTVATLSCHSVYGV